MSERTLRDADDFKALSKALKRQAPQLRKEMNKGLRVAAKPLVTKTRQALRAGLPQRGGLARTIAARPIRVKTATGRDPGITVVADKTDARIDQGQIRHPVYNRRRADGSRITVTQNVQPGLFSGTLEREAPAVVQDIEGVLDDFAERLARG